MNCKLSRIVIILVRTQWWLSWWYGMVWSQHENPGITVASTPKATAQGQCMPDSSTQV